MRVSVLNRISLKVPVMSVDGDDGSIVSLGLRLLTRQLLWSSVFHNLKRRTMTDQVPTVYHVVVSLVLVVRSSAVGQSL